MSQLPTFPPLAEDPAFGPVNPSSRPGRIPAASDRPSVPANSRSTLSYSRFALPDGTPLLLTMSRKVICVSLTGRFGVLNPDEALVLLYLSSPHFNPRARWTAPAPVEEGASEVPLAESDPDYFTALRLRIDDWADSLPHTDIELLYVLACNLWNDQHATEPMTIPGTPDEPGQKKSPDFPPTGPPSSPASSPPATSPKRTASSTTSRSAKSTPPSTRGVRSKASRSSPSRSGKRASPKHKR